MIPVPVAPGVSALKLGSDGIPVSVSDELRTAKARIQELEQREAALLEQGAKMTEARTRIARLESELAEARRPNNELQRLQNEAREQAERVTELQQLWLAEQKEARKALDRADRAEQDRAGLAAQVEAMLRDWHSSEVMASQERLHGLQERIRALTRKPA